MYMRGFFRFVGCDVSQARLAFDGWHFSRRVSLGISRGHRPGALRGGSGR